ncbi:MAG TPA: VTT domain-containing protein [Caballeronia sp.]|jgi:membrane protein DedA with SNARE-associated domain/membrane-associated phospholipid phosphatase|nr:VTT domain-containing protein [Caballeronia sp.]
MEHSYFKLLHLLSGHPAWALTVVLLAAFFESIAFIGTFVPGSTAMFVAGALVGTGTLNLGWVFVCALVGAVAGDAASYWFGCRHKETIAKLWPFRAHPGMLTAGKRYFEAHGAKSVIFARFIAPLRAVVPVVAGMMGMRPMRFLVINIVSALVWAPVHILPGVVFGASIELAGAVSFRLVAVIAILVAATWLTFRLTSLVVSHARAWTDSSRRNLLRWARRHPGAIGRIVLGILDPKHQAAALIAVISALLLVSATVFFSTLHGVSHGDPLVQIDVSVYRFLQSFRSAWGDSVLAVLGTLGSVQTLAAVTLLVVVWMVFERRWRTVAYWLSAVAFSQLLILAIQITIQRPLPGAVASTLRAFPSNHVAASVVIYGFLSFLLARRVGAVARVFVAMAAIAILVSVAFSGLYFGHFTFSDALGGAALAATWVFVVALTAVWRYPVKPVPRVMMPVTVLAVICVSVVLQFKTSLDAMAVEPTQPVIVVTPMQWTDTVWRTFSCYRSSMDGDRLEPITIQWTATAAEIRTQLEGRGWTEGTRLSAHSILSLVSPDVAATALPVLPRLNNGEPSVLVFTRAHTSADERDVLRFWPTQYVVKRRGGQPPTPIWLGSLVHERLLRPSWPFNVLRPDKRIESMIAAHGDASPWRGLEVASSAGCGGIPVTLVASGGQ